MNALISAKWMGSVTLLTLPLICGGCSLSLSLDPKQGQNAAVASTSSMDSSTATLVRLLDSDDPQVRSVAVRGIAEMGENARGAAPSLHRLVDDPDRHVRYEAAKALARVNPDDPALPAMLVLIANDERTPEEQRVEMRSLLHRVSPMYASTSTTSAQTPAPEATVETTTGSHDDDDVDKATTTSSLETRTTPATRPTGSEFSTSPVSPTTRPIMASERSERINDSTSNESSSVTPPTTPATIPPTTRPTTQPLSRNEWSDIPGLTGLVDASGSDAPPAPDINLFGYKSYTSAGAVQVRDWIQRQDSISDKEKQNRIKEFQDWRYGQDKLIYQKVLEK